MIIYLLGEVLNPVFNLYTPVYTMHTMLVRDIISSICLATVYRHRQWQTLDRGSIKEKYFFLLKKRIPGCFVANDESMSALTQQLLFSMTSVVGHNIPSLLLATEVWKYYCWPIFLVKYHQNPDMYKRTGEHLLPVCRQFNHP